MCKRIVLVLVGVLIGLALWITIEIAIENCSSPKAIAKKCWLKLPNEETKVLEIKGWGVDGNGLVWVLALDKSVWTADPSNVVIVEERK